jgi:iron-sulfur cluster assembly protein
VGFVLTLTEGAVEAVRSIVSSSPNLPETAGLRISEAGEEEGQHVVSVAENPLEGDEIVEEKGVRVFLEPVAASHLDDKVLDAETQGSRIRFRISPQT